MKNTNVLAKPSLISSNVEINESVFIALCALIMDAETYARKRRKGWSKERVLAFGALIGELDDWHNELATALIAAKREATIFVINRGLTQAQRSELPIHIHVMAAKMMHQSFMYLCQRYNQAISNQPRGLITVKLSARRFLRSLSIYYHGRYLNLRSMNVCPSCSSDFIQKSVPKMAEAPLRRESIFTGLFC